MRTLAKLSLTIGLVLAACGKDTIPPPAPFVDPIATPTSLSAITVTGSAQYGAIITISGAAAVAPASVVADNFTARFRAVVTLARNARNTLSFTATDQAGKVSAPTTVTVDQSDNYAVSVSNLRVNGVLCAPGGAPPACPTVSGDVIDFDVIANSSTAVSEVQYTAYFSTANALRSQRVLVAPNSPLPYTQHFTFTVPGATLIEKVAIEALSIDSQGNRSTSPQLLLNVNPINTNGRAIAPVAVGGIVSRPNDVAIDSAGNVFIADNGNGDLVKVAAATTFPTVFSGYGAISSFLSADGAGNVYVSGGASLFRVDPAGANVVQYVALAGGSNATGTAIAAPTFAKGLADASAAAAGNTATVGARTYEFQANGVGCAAGNVCVNLNASNKTQALATSVQANSAEANATFDAGTGKAIVSAKSLGAAGNAIVFSTNAPLAISLSGSGKLVEGHDETVFLSLRGGADTNVYRFGESLNAPVTVTASEGSFQVQAPQLGLAVRDLTTAASANLRDIYLYFVDQSSPSTLRAFHAVDSVAPAQTFALTSGGGVNFGSLYDVVLLPTGCLIASDEGTGRIYAFDTRSPTTASPAVTVVASGFSAPRGLGVSRSGDLYVADRGFDAVVRISPLQGSTCF